MYGIDTLAVDTYAVDLLLPYGVTSPGTVVVANRVASVIAGALNATVTVASVRCTIETSFLAASVAVASVASSVIANAIPIS